MSTECYVQWDLTLLKGSFYVINITFKWKFASLFIFDVVTSMWIQLFFPKILHYVILMQFFCRVLFFFFWEGGDKDRMSLASSQMNVYFLHDVFWNFYSMLRFRLLWSQYEVYMHDSVLLAPSLYFMYFANVYSTVLKLNLRNCCLISNNIMYKTINYQEIPIL